jgi:hypothetical protein
LFLKNLPLLLIFQCLKKNFIGTASLLDDGQHNNIGNEQDDVLMDTTDMDESTEADLDDVTDEADPGLLILR